jgi:CheY-like chemotaxis protein
MRDTGIGIDPARLQEIFRPFVQAHDNGAEAGLGLGLAICRGLIDAHHGKIEGHSEGPGRGATFEVTLGTMSDDDAAAASSVPSGKRPRKLRIMLVEDHRDTASVMSKVLTRSGHIVETAGSVHDAVGLAEKPFDVIISDLGLPDGDGCDLMRQLAGRGQGAPAIALSGLASEEDVRRCRDAGFVEHLAKPVDVNMLLTTIAQVASA